MLINTNLIKQLMSYKMGKAEAWGNPPIIIIETTSFCNVNCIMCPYRLMKRKKGPMSMDLFKKIIDEVKDYVKMVILFNYGEPLLDPHFFERVEYCNKYGLEIEISTNATPMTEAVSRKILEHKNIKYICFSFDGFSKETYESIRVGADFLKVLDNIEKFLELKQEYKSDIFVTIQMLQMKKTADEMDAFKEKWRDVKGINEVLLKQFDTRLGTAEDLAFEDQKYNPEGKRSACAHPWLYFVILADGIVVPCCNDYDKFYPLGDTKKQTVKEIWNGEPIKKLRSQMLNHNFKNGLCDSCNYYTNTTPRAISLEELKYIRFLLKHTI